MNEKKKYFLKKKIPLKKKKKIQIKFYKDGEWRVVTIDDQLPCRNDKHLIFSRCKDDNEFWVPLMEKAFAKLNGSYISIESGHLVEKKNKLNQQKLKKKIF